MSGCAMEDRFDDVLLAEHEIRNVRFLLEQQVQVVSMLTDMGRDTADAFDLLRKLMDLESAVRMRLQASQAVRWSALALV